MVDVTFERMAQIIAIAAIGGDDEGIAKYYVKAKQIRVRFSEYVKSQVHLNMVHGLYGRWLKDYVETLWFLSGRLSCERAAQKVLKYFYSDLANFLINNGEPVQLSIIVDTDYFKLEREIISLPELCSDFWEGFEAVKNNSLKMEDWSYATTLDYAKDVSDLEHKAQNYVLALKLLENVETNFKIIESRC